MNSISEIDVANEVYRFASGYQAVRDVGDEIQFKECPFCRGGRSHDTYTFAINKKNGAYNCMRGSCGATGNLYTLSDDPSIPYKLPEKETKAVRKHVRRISAAQMKTAEREPEPEVVEYMDVRGMSAETAKKYGLTISTVKPYEGCMAIPFYSVEGDLLYVKYRKIDGTQFKGGGKERSISSKEADEEKWQGTFFGMKQCTFDGSPLVVTEGQMDAMACAEAGIQNVVSVPFGKNASNWFEESADAQIFLNRFSELVVFGDNENGAITLVGFMRKIFSGRVRVVRVEDYHGKKDANDILIEHGPEAVRAAVENAEALRVRRVKEISEIRNVNMAELERIQSGIAAMDKFLGGMFFGSLVILSGARGEGKSTFASQLASFAVNQGINVFFYSGELTDFQWKMWFKLQVAGPAGITTQRNPITGEDEPLIRADSSGVIEDWYRGKVYVYDNAAVDDEDISLAQTMEECIQQYGCRFLVVDNLMSAMDYDDQNANQNRAETALVDKLRKMSKRFNVIIILVTHLRKNRGKVANNDDVSGSGNITNMGDVVLQYGMPTNSKGESLTADETPDRVLSIPKNRLTGKVNYTGITLHFDQLTKRIYSDGQQKDWCFWKDDEFVSVDGEMGIPFEL